MLVFLKAREYARLPQSSLASLAHLLKNRIADLVALELSLGHVDAPEGPLGELLRVEVVNEL